MYEQVIDFGPEWRNFFGKQDKSRVSYNANLGTVILDKKYNKLKTTFFTLTLEDKINILISETIDNYDFSISKKNIIINNIKKIKNYQFMNIETLVIAILYIMEYGRKIDKEKFINFYYIKISNLPKEDILRYIVYINKFKFI